MPVQDPAPIFRTREAGPTHEVLGMRHVYKATSAEADGRFLIFVLEIPPGCGAPLHRHEIDAECFYVLEGAIRFRQPDGAERDLGPGGFCHLPRGAAHGFHNASAELARALVVAAPGIEAERFFASVDGLKHAGAVEPAQLAALAASHGLRILPGS